jgi:hypothetical protein
MNPYLFAAAKPWNETMKRDDGTRTEKKATAGATRLVTADYKGNEHGGRTAELPLRGFDAPEADFFVGSSFAAD